MSDDKATQPEIGSPHWIINQLNKCHTRAEQILFLRELIDTEFVSKEQHKEDVTIAHMESAAKILSSLNEYTPPTLSMQASVMRLSAATKYYKENHSK